MDYRRNPRNAPYNRNPRYDRGGYSRDRDRGGYDRERKPSFPKKYEDWAWELDFLPNGYMDDTRPKHLRDPILQVLGEQYFSLLEVIIDREKLNDFKFASSTRVYIGKGEENTLGHRFKRIRFDKLTINAKAELPKILEAIISANPDRFLNFFNNSQPITNRMHQLELLPGIGKKTMWAILDARKKKTFENFDDLQERTSINHPQNLIIKRITKELEQPNEKHYIFVRH
ncbi:MAG: DUF655 domain-containing protein [Candidatus Hodarchaeota archaeon]